MDDNRMRLESLRRRPGENVRIRRLPSSAAGANGAGIARPRARRPRRHLHRAMAGACRGDADERGLGRHAGRDFGHTCSRCAQWRFWRRLDEGPPGEREDINGLSSCGSSCRAPVNEALIAPGSRAERCPPCLRTPTSRVRRSGPGEVFANDAPWRRMRRTNTIARLENTVVMITGGAQGIGEGIAHRLASEGAVIAIADLNGDKAKAVAETLKGEGAAGAISVQVDVGDRGQVQAAIKAVVDSLAGSTSCSITLASTSRFRFSRSTRRTNNIMRVNTGGVILASRRAPSK